MEENTQVSINEWNLWKYEIREKLNNTVDNFIFLGYRMKQIRDTKAYEQDECNSITEWANKEYGLSKSDVSRFIAINNKFSVEGNSVELREEYVGLGSSKLSEMLNLPEEVHELVTDKSSVADIREFKRFENQDITLDGLREKENKIVDCVKSYFKDPKRHDMLNHLMKRIKDTSEQAIKDGVMIMNPTEHGTHQSGLTLMVMQDFKDGVKFRTVGQIGVDSFTWEMVFDIIYPIYFETKTGEIPEDFWCNYYGELPVENKKVEKTTTTEKKQEVITTKTEVKKEVEEKPVNTSKISSCDVATPTQKEAEIIEETEEGKEEFTEFSDTIKKEEEEKSEKKTSEELIEARKIANQVVEMLAKDEIELAEINKIQFKIQSMAAVLKRLEEDKEL